MKKIKLLTIGTLVLTTFLSGCTNVGTTIMVKGQVLTQQSDYKGL